MKIKYFSGRLELTAETIVWVYCVIAKQFTRYNAINPNYKDLGPNRREPKATRDEE